MRNLTEDSESFSAKAISGLLPHPSAVLVPASFFIAAFLASTAMCRRKLREGRKRKFHEEGPVGSDIETVLRRKRDFLSRVGDDYGYESQPSGHIDSWRPRDLPKLIHPCTAENKNNKDEAEIYLDYAGAALPTLSQLEKIFSSSQQVLANPHSTGPAASRTRLLIQQAKKRVMDHFQCHPGQLYGLKTTEGTTAENSHPGYEVIFTSGATESLRIVSERFPWTRCNQCSRKSCLLYSQNSHTSVVGMRGPAQASGASFLCKSLSSIAEADVETFRSWADHDIDGSSPISKDCSCLEKDIYHLLAMPLECNFGGTRINVNSIVSAARATAHSGCNQQWYTIVDLAKAAGTGPVNLKELDPDFACVSFYKLFGEPTGLGALFVKRTAVSFLMDTRNRTRNEIHGKCARSHSPRRYFGGGSVDSILSGLDFAVPRSEPSALAALENGTIHFRGIANLIHGFEEIARVGGMAAIKRHSTCVAEEFAKRLSALRHGNGAPAAIIYGAWSEVPSLGAANPPGPTVPFNVLRPDGSFVGYNEVSKLAALNRPPLQLRTGCFCNPGACQEALELSNEQIQSNYFTSGHVCGDQIDIVDSRPTGAVRASFGKDSIWEDMDALVAFIEKVFVNKSAGPGSTLDINLVPMKNSKEVGPTMVQLSELYIFPIKSCAAQRVKNWKVTKCGRLAFDREFALVDSSGHAMRLQNYPRMGLVKPEIDLKNRRLTVAAPGCKDLVLDLDDKWRDEQHNDDAIVRVCGNQCGGKLWGDYCASAWFSSFLGVQCWLARHSGGRNVSRLSNCSNDSPSAPLSSSGHHKQRADIAFANEQPMLLVSEHAVSILNGILSKEGHRLVNSRHFRPNLVVKSVSGQAFDMLETNPEDKWSKLVARGKEASLNVAGQCARCSMVDVDPTSGMKGRTLSALAEYRRHRGQITFGIFLQGRFDATKKDLSEDQISLAEGDVFDCL